MPGKRDSIASQKNISSKGKHYDLTYKNNKWILKKKLKA